MDGRPGLAVTGAAGRMGQTVLRLAAAAPAFRLVAALERPGHPALGRDAGEAGGGPALGVRLSDDAVAAFARAEAVIDFTSPAASVAHAGLAAQARAVHVIGTTGFAPDDLGAIARAARHAAIVRSGNMSVGVNLLVGLVARVAAALGPEFDVEILEAHHRAKVDAPSGTALMLGEAAAKGRGVALDEVADRVRDGVTGPRAEGHIGFASLRGGDIVGEHDVLFAGPGERLVLRHVATDRTIFARGALRAAAWGLGRPPGQYTMADVLGL